MLQKFSFRNFGLSGHEAGALAIVGLCALLTSACASNVFTSAMDSSESGLKYYLPKTLVTLEIIPVGFKIATVVAELNDAQKELATGVTNVRVNTVIGGQRYTVLVNGKGELTAPLITGLRLKVKSVENAADPKAGLTLQYQASRLSTDRVCMGIDEKNLLSFAQASTKDNTGDIIVSIGKLVGRVVGPAPFAGGSLQQAEIDELKLTLRIDPLDPHDRTYVQHAIDTRFPQFRGDIQFFANNEDYFLPESEEDEPDCPGDSICYRTMAPLRLTLKNRHNGNHSIAYAKVVNRAVTHHIDISRAFLVEKITKLGFSGGVLSSVKIDKPSEGLAAAQLPLTVYDAVLTSALAAPGRFLGEITPGMKTSEYKLLIEQYRDNVTAVNTLRQNLQSIRQGDLTVQSTQPTTFAINCSN